ncbi:MAG: 2-oxo acid dehydrogenase subunit E2 [Candidatus Helarchaeota archaeon]|nr:2-oxo acid dehydrogenase subunit E2 [Candidatus Helarchaeota archaeon]
MTLTKMIMPKLGMTMEEGTIIQWLKKEGDTVEKGEKILEIETDKVTIEVEAPATGILRKIIATENQIVPIGGIIAIIADAGEEFDLEAIMAEESRIKPSITLPATPISHVTERPAGRIIASPRAKKLAKDKNVDLRYVRGSGPSGRIIEKDVIQYLEQPTDITRTGVKIKEILPIRGIRKVIAERMSSSLQTAAQLTITMETNVSNLARFRNLILPTIEEKEGIRVSYTEIFVKVVSKVLEEFPIVNSIVEDNRIKILDEINIGVAVATEEALIVPVIHDANKKSILEISKVSKDLINKTRSGKLSLNDLSKGTFTVTNLGMFGVDIFTPILNPPESGILGVGRIIKKWVVKNEEEQPKIAPTMQLSLTWDHRVIDGHIAAQFLGRIKEIIENYNQLFSFKWI